MTGWPNRLRRHVLNWRRAALGLVFPPRCALCDAELATLSDAGLLCEACSGRVKADRASRCRRCAGATGGNELPTDGCPLCRRASLRFDAAVALGGYHTGFRDLVLRMKWPAHEALSRAMGRMLAEQRGGQLLEYRPDVAVPVPMFWLRRLRRGVNSPEIVARCLGQSLGLPVRRDLLVRHRNTEPQAGLSPERRFKNVEDAFRVRRRRPVDGARVLLLDDILTTGATCSEAARVLKQAGAECVVVAVIARTQGTDGA